MVIKQTFRVEEDAEEKVEKVKENHVENVKLKEKKESHVKDVKLGAVEEKDNLV